MIGVILAGGGSTRMGRSKAELPLADGRAMIEHVRDALEGVFGTVLIVNAEDDLRPGQGPLAGIETVLAGAEDRDFVFCPCDVPLVTTEILEALSVQTAAPATVLRFEDEPHPRPLPARFNVSALPAVSHALDRGRRAIHRVLLDLEPHVVPAPAEWARALTNVNTPEEYEALLRDP